MTNIELAVGGRRSRHKRKRKRKLMSTRAVAERYSRSPRTIERWRKDPRLNFPKPFEILGRNYQDEDELDDFDAQQAARAR